MNKNLNTVFKVWVSLLFLFTTFTKLPNIPQRTHDIAAFMFNTNCIDCGLGLLANSIIASPIYIFLKYFFSTLKGYLLIQCVFLIITFFILFKSFIKLSENENQNIISKISLIIISIILLLNSFGGNWSNIPEYLGIGVNFISYNFSARSVLSLSYFIACYLLIKNRIYLSGLFILFGMLSHPTNGLIIFITIVGFLFFNHFFKVGLIKSNYKKLIVFLVLGFIPIFFKLLTLENIFHDFPIEKISRSEYIESMYRDEIDDFSALYIVYSSKITLIASLIFSLTPILISYFFRKKIKEINKIKLLSTLIAGPLFIFFTILCIEIIYINFGSLEFIMEKIINSQLGCRVLKYSGIPALLIYILLINFLINYKNFKEKFSNKFINLICIIFFTIITIFMINRDYNSSINEFLNVLSNKSKNFSEYGRMAYYEDLIDSGYEQSSVNERFLYDCKCGKIYNNLNDSLVTSSTKTIFNFTTKFDQKIDINYKYDNYFLRRDITKTINNIIKKGSKIITPTYLYCFREFLPNYDIFFQEHDDGNFMLGSKKIYEKFKPRMKLLSFSYQNLPSQVSGLMTNQIRKNWLELKGKDFEKFKNQGFKYIITEKSHKINLPIIHEDSNWIIYEIN